MWDDRGISLCNAIGLGIRIAGLSSEIFRHRLMTFGTVPEWLDLSIEPTFVEKVQRIARSSWSANADLYRALRLILSTLISSSVSPRDAEGIVLVILSDMQIDRHGNRASTVYEDITAVYCEAGLSSKYREAYPVPHILFWNLRSTNGFPVLTEQSNVTMFSGFSSAPLNVFACRGSGLREKNPRMTIDRLLSHPRYKAM